MIFFGNVLRYVNINKVTTMNVAGLENDERTTSIEYIMYIYIRLNYKNTGSS